MSFSRVYAIFLRQLYLIRGNPSRLVSIFLWVTLDVIMWGFISKYLMSFGGATFSFVTVILGAIILWDFVSRIQQGIMMSFLEDIWAQNFINVFVSPITIAEYVGGLVLTSFTTGLAGFAAMLLIAGLAFGYNVFAVGALFLPFFVILLAFGISIGLVVCAIIFRFGPSAEWIGWPLPFLLSIFSGVFYPVATLPFVLQAVSKLIPASYIFSGMRTVLSTGAAPPNLAGNLLVSTALALAYLLLAYVFFVRMYRRNVRNGTIAQFNAVE